MFGITGKIRNAATAGALVAVTGVIALAGLVWLTFAAFAVLALYVAEPAAMLLVGLVLMVPLLVVLVQNRNGRSNTEEPPPSPSTDYEAIARLVGTARGLAERAPLASGALALGAAYFASRSPATSALSLQILAEVIDQWAASKTADESAETDTADPSP